MALVISSNGSALRARRRFALGWRMGCTNLPLGSLFRIFAAGISFRPGCHSERSEESSASR
jgi:hypothetical protein